MVFEENSTKIFLGSLRFICLLENFPENFLPVQSNDKKLLNSYTSVQGPSSRHLPKHLIGCKKSKFCELCLVSSIYFWWLRILNFKRLTLCNFVKPNVNKVNDCSINQNNNTNNKSNNSINNNNTNINIYQ